MAITFKTLLTLIKSDMYRYEGKRGIATLFRYLLFRKGFKLTFYFRICHYMTLKGRRLTQLPFKFMYLRYCRIYCVDLPVTATFGSGLYLGHCFGTVIHPRAVLGKNINLSQQVTIGQANRGKLKGVPTIGDNVYIGPGAKVIGKVIVGNNVCIGANCVVVNDLPDNAVVVGIPGKVVSNNGAEGYVNNTDY